MRGWKRGEVVVEGVTDPILIEVDDVCFVWVLYMYGM